MRAATLDQRIAGTSFGWEGERNGSPSVQRVNGTVVRRNLIFDPRQKKSGHYNLVPISGQFGPFDTASQGQVNDSWKDFWPTTNLPVQEADMPSVVRFWLATSTLLFIQNLSKNITLTIAGTERVLMVRNCLSIFRDRNPDTLW